MSVKVQQWAIGKWADRASLEYHPINSQINGRQTDAFGRLDGTTEYRSGNPRRYHKEDGTYVIYDDDTNTDVVIIKLSAE